MELIATIGTAMVAVETGLRLLSGHVSYEQALVSIVLAGEFYLPLRALGTQFHASMDGRVVVEKLDALVTDEGNLHPQADRGKTQWPLASCSTVLTPPVGRRSAPVLQVQHVAYRYPGALHDAIAIDDLAIHKGDRVALIGPSGAGKSTLLHLMLGFLQPQSGVVLAQGHPLAHETARAWRRDVAYVPQEPHVFSGSILENIWLARPSADVREVMRAAEMGGVTAFARAFPRGMETQVGSGGVWLSAGERQRIALARAWLKGGSTWFLDEPTASLDVESESRFLEALASLPRDCTVVVIAHRVTTVERMNRIVALQNGRVASDVALSDPAHGRGAVCTDDDRVSARGGVTACDKPCFGPERETYGVWLFPSGLVRRRWPPTSALPRRPDT